jgi:hypothetical protein
MIAVKVAEWSRVVVTEVSLVLAGKSRGVMDLWSIYLSLLGQRVLRARGGLKFPDPDKTSPSIHLSPIPPSRPGERSLFSK